MLYFHQETRVDLESKVNNEMLIGSMCEDVSSSRRESDNDQKTKNPREDLKQEDLQQSEEQQIKIVCKKNFKENLCSDQIMSNKYVVQLFRRNSEDAQNQDV